MDREEKAELINDLYNKMHEAKERKIKGLISYNEYALYRRKILSTVSKLQNEFTHEDYKKMMQERSELDVRKIND